MGHGYSRLPSGGKRVNIGIINILRKAIRQKEGNWNLLFNERRVKYANSKEVEYPDDLPRDRVLLISVLCGLCSIK